MRIEQIAPLFGVLRFYINDDHNVMWYGGDIAKMLGFKHCSDAIKRHTSSSQRALKQRPGYPHQLAYYLNYDGFKGMCRGVHRRDNKDRANGVLVALADFQEEARREWNKIPNIKIQKVSGGGKKDGNKIDKRKVGNGKVTSLELNSGIKRINGLILARNNVANGRDLTEIPTMLQEKYDDLNTLITQIIILEAAYIGRECFTLTPDDLKIYHP